MFPNLLPPEGQPQLSQQHRSARYMQKSTGENRGKSGIHVIGNDERGGSLAGKAGIR
jgi:hypothetical protein